MLAITPQMKILVAIEPADFRKGIDGLVRLCQDALGEDPFAGTVFCFRNRRRTAIKVLVYDGQGFWLCHKRLSSGKFEWWPSARDAATKQLAAHQLAVLFSAGNPERTGAAPDWRPVTPTA
jgi:transposase